MKKISIRLLLLLLGVSAGLVSCIHDDTTGFVKEISEITVTKVFGEGVDEEGKSAVVNSGSPVHFEAEVEQTIEGYELSYEWKAGLITGYDDEEPKMDSLFLISESRILEYPFNRVGTFLVRLRVYNEFGSTFYYMTVDVKAGMERGVMVLCSDDAGKGSLAFCAVEREANELLQAKAADFRSDVWSTINPDEELTGVRDMVVMDFGDYKNSVFVLSESQHAIYELESHTMLLMRSIDLTTIMDIKPVAMVPCRQNMAVMTESGQVVYCDVVNEGVVDDSWGTTMKSVKLAPSVYNDWTGWDLTIPISADNENEKMVGYLNLGGMKTDSGNDFKGRRIVNFASIGTSRSRSLLVVSQPANSSDKAWITVYPVLRDTDGLNNMFGKEGGYQEREYTLDAPLTFDINSEMIFNGNYNVIFYNKDNTVYRWRHGGSFSDFISVSVPSGEIACMAESPDGEYLYVGVYDAAASGLKGSVYIYATQDLSLVKSFVGVMDKPLKLCYKDIK